MFGKQSVKHTSMRFPLVHYGRDLKRSSTNYGRIDPIKGKAPVNQLMHGEQLADASFKNDR